jgi:hypothetical protein
MLSIVLGLCALITVQLVRTLPPVARWTLAGRKPWACHVCMSVWTALAWGSAIDGYRWIRNTGAGPEIYEILAAAGLCYLALRFLDTQAPPLP